MADNQTILDDEFMKDAEEGLQQISDKNKLSLIVEQLNQDLEKKLAAKKERRSKRTLKASSWTYLAIILIIFLVVIAYLVINKLYVR